MRERSSTHAFRQRETSSSRTFQSESAASACLTSYTARPARLLTGSSCIQLLICPLIHKPPLSGHRSSDSHRGTNRTTHQGTSNPEEHYEHIGFLDDGSEDRFSIETLRREWHPAHDRRRDLHRGSVAPILRLVASSFARCAAMTSRSLLSHDPGAFPYRRPAESPCQRSRNSSSR